MLVLVCGSRNWTNIIAIRRELSALPSETEIIHGGARGADSLAGIVAKELGFPVQVFPANWDEFGKAAGAIRNQRMMAQCPDLVLAFTEDLSTSRGTADSVWRAKCRNIKTRVFSR